MAGGNVRIAANAEKNVRAAGGNVSVDGTIGGTLSVMGGNVILRGSIERLDAMGGKPMLFLLSALIYAGLRFLVFIPFLGWALKLVILVAVLGAIVRVKMNVIRKILS